VLVFVVLFSSPERGLAAAIAAVARSIIAGLTIVAELWLREVLMWW
jgi:hypothetical protein